MSQDEKYIKFAIKLAEKAKGKCFPNPMVGAILVKNNEIVGKGYHKKYGESHAEVIAINEAGEKAKGATLYVTLEPCSHHGLTPPCTDLIIKSKIKKVIFAHLDPNEKVSGNGKAILEANGIEVQTNILADEAAKLNEAFIICHLLKRPLITLKLATSLDGFISDVNGKSQWITCHESRKFVHRLRARHQAIMVGTQTVLDDNPALNVRHVKGNDPKRIVLDKWGKIPKDSNIFSNGNYIVFSSVVPPTPLNEGAQQSVTPPYPPSFRGVIASPSTRGTKVEQEYLSEKDFKIENILRILAEKYGIISLFVEGGSQLVSSFIKLNFYDYFYHFTAPFPLGDGKSMFSESFSLDSHPHFKREKIKVLDKDLLIKYRKEPFDIKMEGDRCLPA